MTQDSPQWPSWMLHCEDCILRAPHQSVHGAALAARAHRRAHPEHTVVPQEVHA